MAVRVLLLIIAAPILLLTAEYVANNVLWPDPQCDRECQAEVDRILDETVPSAGTPAPTIDVNRVIDEILRERQR